MKCNIGKQDRTLRIIVGLAALGAGAVMQSLWGLVGLVPLLTGVLRWCPLYLPIHLNTDKK